MMSVKLPELPEADGWIFQHEDTGLMTTLENDGINNPENFKENNPRHVLCEAIYSERKLHAYARAAVEANRVVVTDEMVERACRKATSSLDPDEEWPGNYEDADWLRGTMRAALIAAMKE